jgi:hypothetical protein
LTILSLLLIISHLFVYKYQTGHLLSSSLSFLLLITHSSSIHTKPSQERENPKKKTKIPQKRRKRNRVDITKKKSSQDSDQQQHEEEL